MPYFLLCGRYAQARGGGLSLPCSARLSASQVAVTSVVTESGPRLQPRTVEQHRK